MMRSLRRLSQNSDGAVAPTIALSLLALIAVGGIAFDYARLASMDTELQNAADQAALAAASQLDGETGACSRAAAAARTMITNLTYMANDSAAKAIVIANEPSCDAVGNVRFYQNITKTTAATNDANAKFVEVQVDPRRAFYALTPVVARFQSGALTAIAFAGLGEAICRVPPLMLCNPNESGDPNFTVANYVGKGVRLVANDGGGNYAPGNFGFLDVGQGNGASALRAVLGRNGDPGDCSAGGSVTTEPGNMITLRDALNTRFDMYDNGLNAACNPDGSLCPPSANSRKDFIRKGTGTNACGFTTGVGQPGWREAANAYPPAAQTPTHLTLTDAEINALAPMGYPRDECHAVSITGVCTGGRIGDGVWDRYAYFRSHSAVNYGTEGASVAAMNTFLTNAFGTTTPSRYQVYQYEMNHAATRLQAEDLGGGLVAHGSPVCNPPGTQPSTTQIDRRVFSVAVVNCAAEGVNGRTPNVDVKHWIDIFLVEPSEARTRAENSDVYVEVVGETLNTTENGAIQAVKKSVPYLIE
jgi:Flp pilus assembly protein TadG